MIGMTDAEIEAMDIETINLRRHFRAMTLPQAWGAVARLWVGTHLLEWGAELIAPYVTPSTQSALESHAHRLAADFTTANEGLEERRGMLEKRLRQIQDRRRPF